MVMMHVMAAGTVVVGVLAAAVGSVITFIGNEALGTRTLTDSVIATCAVAAFLVITGFDVKHCDTDIVRFGGDATSSGISIRGY